MDPEEQGAIDTSDQPAGSYDQNSDNSGAAPVLGGEAPNGGGVVPAEDDSSGVNAAVADQRVNHQFTGYGGMNLDPRDAGSGAKRIIAYLMGADAAHPQSIDQIGAQIDPEGKLDPSDRNVMAIDHVREKYGDNAAWQLMQSNRVAYNGKSAFAKAALQGTPQKPADLNAAVDAANQAQSHVLDGSSIQFTPGRAGVTATVKLPGSSQTQQIALSPQAFSAFLDVGGDGQWDKVMEHSAPATLARLAKQFPVPQVKPNGNISRLDQMPPVQGAAPQVDQTEAPAAQVGNSTDNGEKEPPAMSAWGETADQLTPDGHKPWIPPRTGNYGNELENRALARFPSIGENNERQDWMAAQEEKELQRNNQVEIAKEKGELANKRAEITGGYHVKGAEATAHGKVEAAGLYSEARKQQALARLQAEAQREAGLNARAGQHGIASGAIALINSGQIDKLSPQQRVIAGLDPAPQQQVPAQTAQPQQQAQPKQQSPGRPPVPGAKFYKGQWYTRGPAGESVPVPH